MKLTFLSTEALKAAVGDRDRTIGLLAGLVDDLGAAVACLALTDEANAELLALALDRVASANVEVRAEINRLEHGGPHGQH